jgi:hypothetical protein
VAAAAPALDVIGRQQHVMSAFEVMRESRRPIDPMRVQAIQFLDAALGTDRRQLIKQYVENAETGPKLADRLWQAIYELAQGFMVAYHGALEEALSQPNNARWKSLVPLLFTRHTHYAGTDAKLRVFRYERWIPAKWADMHRAFLRATELGVDRIATSVQGAGQNQTPWTLEQEYLYVLLVHQLNTGNMTPGEIDWACSQLRAWSRRLALDAVPRSPKASSRHRGSHSFSVAPATTPARCCYLDTSSLADQIDRAILSLRQAESTDQPGGPDQPAAHRDPRRCGRRSRRTCSPTCAMIRASRKVSARAHRPRAHLPRVRREGRRGCGRGQRTDRVDRGLRGCGRAAHEAADARRARLARREPLGVLDRCGRSRTASRARIRRRAASARASRSRPRRSGRATFPTGCSASCAD